MHSSLSYKPVNRYFVCVLQVTHNQLNVLDLSWMEEGAGLLHEELEPVSRSMAASLRQLIDQRDKASEVRDTNTQLTLRLVIAHAVFTRVRCVTCAPDDRGSH